MNTNEKKDRAKRGKKKKIKIQQPSWEMNSFSETLIPDAGLAGSICSVSLALSPCPCSFSAPSHFVSHFLSGISLGNTQIHLAAFSLKNQLRYSILGTPPRSEGIRL